jgi:hypothetical protein
LTTFDADVQTFSLDPIKKQLLKHSNVSKDKLSLQKQVVTPLILKLKQTLQRVLKSIMTPTPKWSTALRCYAAEQKSILMILFTQNTMQKREFDARVGYFFYKI